MPVPEVNSKEPAMRKFDASKPRAGLIQPFKVFNDLSAVYPEMIRERCVFDCGGADLTVGGNRVDEPAPSTIRSLNAL